MKYVTLFILLMMSVLSSAQDRAKLTLEPGRSIILDYSDYGDCSVDIRSRGKASLEVAVLDAKTTAQVRGFGMGSGKNTVTLERSSVLYLKNDGTTMANISLRISPRTIIPVSPKPAEREVAFTLENTSDASIPLLIPSVMNPNLSPKSKSGVRLAYGQEIFFRHKGKKRLLLKVDDSISQGDVLDVTSLIEKRLATMSR